MSVHPAVGTKKGGAKGTAAQIADLRRQVRRLETTPVEIAPESLDGTDLAPASITTEQIATGSITADSLAAGSVTAASIQAYAITAGLIAANAITAGTIAAGAVTAGTIAANAVTATSIAANSIATTHIQAAAVDAQQINAGAIRAVHMSVNSIDAGAIQAGVVTTIHLAANSITTSNIVAGAVTADRLAANSITADRLAVNSIQTYLINVGGVNGTMISDGAITTQKIAANAVEADKIKAGVINASHIVVGGMDAQTVIAPGSITTGTIKADAITSGKIAADSITSRELIGTTLSALSSDMGNLTAGTITGGTVQTSASGARVVIDSNGLRGYGLDGVAKVFEINAGTGVASFTGVANIATGSVIPAITVSGELGQSNIPIIGNDKVAALAASKLTGTVPAAQLPKLGSGNLLVNSSFENYDNYLTGYYFNCYSPGTVAPYKDWFLFGTQSVRMIAADGGGIPALQVQTTPEMLQAVRTGRAYTVSVYVKNLQSVPQNITLFSQTHAPAGYGPGYLDRRVIAAGEVSRFIIAVPAGAPDPTIDSLAISIQSQYNASSDFAVDGYQMQFGEVATEWSPKPDEPVTISGISPSARAALTGGQLNDSFQTTENWPIYRGTGSFTADSATSSATLLNTNPGGVGVKRAEPVTIDPNTIYRYSVTYSGHGSHYAGLSNGSSEDWVFASNLNINTDAPTNLVRYLKVGGSGSGATASDPASLFSVNYAKAYLILYIANGNTGDLKVSNLKFEAVPVAASIAGQLSNSQIADLAATKLTGQITETQITDNAISTGKLAASAVTAGKIAAGSVTAEKLTVGSIGSSMVLNGGFEEGNAGDTNIPAGWSRDYTWGSGSILRTASAAKSGSSGMRLGDAIPGVGTPASLVSQPIPVQPGDVLYFAFWARAAGNGNTVAYIGMGQNSVPTISGGHVSTWLMAGQPLPGAWTKYTYNYVVPAGITWVAPVFLNYQQQTVELDIDDVEVSKVTVSAQIADGAITTPKILAGSITADKILADSITSNEIKSGTILASDIKAYEITALQIAANTISADKIVVGGMDAATIITPYSIQTLQLATGSVKANTIDAGAVTATKLSIVSIDSTGSLVANSVGNTQLTSNAVTTEKILANNIQGDRLVANAITAREIATDAVTANKIKAGEITADKIVVGGMNAATVLTPGTVTTGTLSATAIDGKTITGATIRTAATGGRLELTTGNLIAYDTDGATPLVTLAPGTGMTLRQGPSEDKNGVSWKRADGTLVGTLNSNWDTTSNRVSLISSPIGSSKAQLTMTNASTSAGSELSATSGTKTAYLTTSALGSANVSSISVYVGDLAQAQVSKTLLRSDGTSDWVMNGNTSYIWKNQVTYGRAQIENSYTSTNWDTAELIIQRQDANARISFHYPGHSATGLRGSGDGRIDVVNNEGTGYFYLRGLLENVSDERLKTNFTKLDNQSTLGKLKAMKVTRYRWKQYDGNLPKHGIGPTAQEFHKHFPGLSGSESSGKTDLPDQMIVATDGIGVAFSAIQGLLERIEQLERLLRVRVH